MTQAIAHADSATDTAAVAIDNLLIGCGKVEPGSRVLLVNEPNRFGVERAVVEHIEQRARELGAEVRSIWTGPVAGPEHISNDVLDAIAASDVSILNHSIGGMLRLRKVPGSGIGILNYATNEAILRSPWTQVPYALWEKISKLIGAELSRAQSWRITCGSGTDLRGAIPESERRLPPASTGFSLLTFPIGTHRPIGSPDAEGTLAIRWLVSSANHDVGSGLRLDNIVHATVKSGRITGFQGPEPDVTKARDFLTRVGEENGVDPYIVNSWHGGTNPLAFTPWQDHQDLNGWQVLSHNNPRTLHFHAVGTVVPGELSLPVLDPTVSFDGEVFWDKGRFALLERPAIQDVLGQFPQVRDAFVLNRAIGV